MGSSNSYLKIKVTENIVGIVFKYGDASYYKQTICVGRPEKSYNQQEKVTSRQYDNYGEWYIYDGNYKKLDTILLEFKPKEEPVDQLIDKLETHCNLKKYESTWGMFKRWAYNVYKLVEKPLALLSTLGTVLPVITWLFGGTSTPAIDQ